MVDFSGHCGGTSYFQELDQPELHYRYWPATRGLPVVALLHGLGDRLEELDGLARFFREAGFGTLQVDLHGHGRTLERQYERNASVPSVIDYRLQVESVERLIRALELRDLILVGHSYGGGIALALGTRLERHLNVTSIHQLAPYVIRLDAYFSQKYLGGGLLSTRRPPLRRRFRTSDGTGSSVSRGFLARQYQGYFLRKLGKLELELSRAEVKWLQVKVQAAVAATWGIQGLNAFHDSFEFPRKADLHLVLGDADPLVPPELLLEYRDHVLERGRGIETTVLERADHFFPQNRVAEVFERILEVVRVRHPVLLAPG